MSNLAQLLPTLLPQFLDTNGQPLASGQIYSYIAGTTTPQATYTDASGVTPNANPVILDSNGCAQIWMLSSESYKFVVQDSLGNTIYTRDNVQSINDKSVGANALDDDSVTARTLDSDVAGSALALDGTSNALNVQVDNTTIAVITNKLGVKAGSIGLTQLVSNIFSSINTLVNLQDSGIEVVFRNSGDFDMGNAIIGVPQYQFGITPTPVSDPGTLPANSANAAAFSPNGEFLAIANGSTPSLVIYQRQAGNVFTALSSPAALPAGTATGVAWSPNGRFLAVTSGGSPFLYVYARSGSTFIKLPNPGSIPPGACNGCAWSPNGEFLSVACSVSPYIGTYQFSGGMILGTYLATPTGDAVQIGNVAMPASYSQSAANSSIDTVIGAINQELQELLFAINNSGTAGTFSLLSSPVNLPAGAATGCVWSSSGSLLAVAHSTSPYLTLYTFSGGTFSKVADPATLPPGNGLSVAFSPSEGLLLHGSSSSPYLTVYSITGSVAAGNVAISLPTQPAALPTGAANSISFSPNGAYIAVGMGASPYLRFYNTVGVSTFTFFFNASSIPGNVFGTSWSPNSQFLAYATSASPYIGILQSSSTLPTNAVLWTRQVNNV